MDAAIAVGQHSAILVGYRYYRLSDADPSVTVATILNPTEISLMQSLDDVSDAFGTPRLHMSSSGTRVLIGIKVSP